MRRCGAAPCAAIVIVTALAAATSWTRLSSRNGDLPAPNSGTQQTASLVLDVDRDGVNDFVITERTQAPAAVWYRRGKKGWTKYIVESEALHIEAGGAACDVDGDGDLDVIFGGDYQSNEVWWWENPHPRHDPQVAWKRRAIKNSGKPQHHDQLVGDFDGDGKEDLAFWNQGDRTLYLARIPADPRQAASWPLTPVLVSESKSEGLAKADIDGDGKVDIIGGGRWFQHKAGNTFTPHIIDDAQRNSRAAAGQLKRGGRPEVVFVIGDGVGRLKWYEWRNDAWIAHDLLGADVIHGHTLQIVDIDRDGNLDIFCAEMAKWTERAPQPDNPEAKMWIFYGDGKGNFTARVIATGQGTHEGRVADLNGDGRLDLLLKPYNWDAPRLDVWLNAGGTSARRAARCRPRYCL